MICRSVLPDVIPLVKDQRLSANESGSATLNFTIGRAHPPVDITNIHWFYSNDSITEEITFLKNRPGLSSIYTFSSDRLNLTINNVVQARVEGEPTDAGRYTLEATNEAGVGSSYIDVLVFGKCMFIIIIWVHVGTWRAFASLLLTLTSSPLPNLCTGLHDLYIVREKLPNILVNNEVAIIALLSRELSCLYMWHLSLTYHHMSSNH